MDVHDIDTHWDYKQPAESEARFRELLEKSGGETVAYRAELLSQIARAQGMQANFREAHTTLNNAEALLTEGMQRARVRVLLERGRAFNSSQASAKAMPLFQEALELAQAAGEEFMAVDAAHMLGIAAPTDQRIELNKQALAMAEASEDQRAQGWVGSLYNNLGYFYMEDRHYNFAMDYFDKLLKHTTQKGDEEFADIARWFIAKVHRLTENYDKALAGQMQLMKKNAQKELESAYVYEELGEIYLALGNEEERRNYFQLAYDVFTSDDRYVFEVKYEQARLERILDLAQN